MTGGGDRVPHRNRAAGDSRATLLGLPPALAAAAVSPASRRRVSFAHPARGGFDIDREQDGYPGPGENHTLPPGSYLVLSHLTGDIRPEVAAKSEAEYKKVTPEATLRTQEEILRFFSGLNLLDPGLVPVPRLVAGQR
jgi:hypothetical protein